MPSITNDRIIENRELVPGYFQLIVESPQVAEEALPGQFVQVSCSEGIEPLLRKPLSLSYIDRDKGTITLVYQIRGRGTTLLSRMESGETISLLGPLGKGFQYPKDMKRALVLGGGIGVAPLWALTRKLQDSDVSSDVILGFNGAEDMILTESFSDLAHQVLVTTMDGSCGIHGHSCVPLESRLNLNDYDMVYACGPEPMLRAVQERTAAAGVACQLSLESYMACGIGACLGCVCRTRDQDGNSRYDRVCVEGPVFDSREVDFDE